MGNMQQDMTQLNESYNNLNGEGILNGFKRKPLFSNIHVLLASLCKQVSLSLFPGLSANSVAGQGRDYSRE